MLNQETKVLLLVMVNSQYIQLRYIEGKDEIFEFYAAAIFSTSIIKGELDYLCTWVQADIEESTGQRDICNVITYFHENRKNVIMMETTNADLRQAPYVQLAREKKDLYLLVHKLKVNLDFCSLWLRIIRSAVK